MTEEFPCLTDPLTGFKTIGDAANSALAAILVTRLERAQELKRLAIAESRRDCLLRLEGEESAIQQILDEYATRILGRAR